MQLVADYDYSPEILDMANASELTERMVALEERVTNYIKFFWTVIACLAVWLGYITVLVVGIRGTTKQTASNIEALSIRENLTGYAIAKPDDLKNDLPKVDSNLQAATKHKVKVAPPVLSNLQAKLSAIDPTTPEYWPVAAQFISYRSQVNVVDFQSLSRPNMPNCTDHLPTPMEYRMTSEEERSTKEETNRVVLDSSRFTPAIYENCRFVLDSPEEAKRFPLLGKSFDLEFKNCQIIYNGGPIAIITPNPRFSLFNGKGPTRGDVFVMNGQKLRFENCLFLFTIEAVPPQEGQQMTHELLAQSGTTLSYGHVSIGG